MGNEEQNATDVVDSAKIKLDKTPRRTILSSIGLIAGGSLAAQAIPESAHAQESPSLTTTELSFDVASNGITFRNLGPTVNNGGKTPAAGAPFYLEGIIYPSGKLTASNGLNADGTSEFPNFRIGTWYCRGYFTKDAVASVQGPFVFTTHMYDLSIDTAGKTSVISEGIELATLNTPFLRALTGGTGVYNTVTGQVEQTIIGSNATGFANLRFVFKLNGV
jgi:hypothetical protein